MITHRVAVIDRDLCKPKKCSLECIAYCPLNKSGAKCITLNNDTKSIAVIDENICNGCGICVKKCPYKAITIVNLAQEWSERKIHQYGPNSFRLYNLPIPKEKTIIGLLGRNGMGKSTLLNILAGNIKPNFGNYNRDITFSEIIERLQSDAKSYFEKLANGNIKISIKPQMVNLIPKVFKGSAKELLSKYDERGISNMLVKRLDLINSLDKRLDELSGGELQRLAVTVSVSKDADFYFFDEPSSYNDVYQRLEVARVIHELSKEKSVMVIEHDIALLDYLSDYVYILYGEPGVYGIVSDLLSTKVGINSFLEGYLSGINIRFRDRPFRFESMNREELIKDVSIVEYNQLVKEYPSFRVKIDKGKLREGEIVGVVGANALGKTTFMKMIAGLIKPDQGSIELKAKISYKPQYLTQEYDSDVRSLLTFAYGKPIEMTNVEEQIIMPMHVDRLYDKYVNSLSGGELQKVAIVTCLLRDADIYAFDEPSAFLDIEDRISLAKFIHRFVRAQGKSAIVIDHDLQLIDLIADTIIVFHGITGKEGYASETLKKQDAMNLFLKDLSITFRRDPASNRPRVNKLDSRLDREQKMSGNYYLIK
ncbi:MAG: ribosome biogenesis/translation initiation ATPase RLI [Candidatus Nitrosocaldaceae archaeon]